MMDEPESKYNLEGLASISMLMDLDRRVSKALSACMTMEYLAKMIDWGTLRGMVWHSITIHSKKSKGPSTNHVDT